MIFDAIVLAGGRASRLDGASKADLVVGGRTLLTRSLDATAGARQVVIVGAPTVRSAVVPAGVLVTREDPVFGGPAAAIAAGLDALLDALAVGSPADFVLVLACDVPNSAAAVGELLTQATDALTSGGADGVLAVDFEGHRQPLLGLYRLSPLARAVHGRRSDIQNLSVRALLSPLDLTEIRVPAGSTDDIDTWADAAGFGISPPGPPVLPPATKGQPMSDRDDEATLRSLTQWSDRLRTALGIEGVEVDIEAVLALAGTAAHAVMRPAAPLTTYLVGYAAGVAAGIAAASQEPGVDGAGCDGAAFDNAVAIAASLANSDTR